MGNSSPYGVSNLNLEPAENLINANNATTCICRCILNHYLKNEKHLNWHFLKFMIDKIIVDSIPSAARRESVSGLKSNVPAIDRAVTNSGEVTNA